MELMPGQIEEDYLYLMNAKDENNQKYLSTKNLNSQTTKSLPKRSPNDCGSEPMGELFFFQVSKKEDKSI
jgi:hypothetical protein